MISKQLQQLTIFTLLLFCSTQYFGVDSITTYGNDFYASTSSIGPYINSYITGRPVYMTPYYVSTGVETLHAMSIKGKGVKLGIIDSGINFGINAFEGNYVYNRKFVDINSNQIRDKLQCNNRGTHMAGIAVAKTGYFAGVAPEATLGTYRVFGCEGPTSTSLVLQAIRTAVNDQMQIIVLPEIPVVDEAGTELRTTIEDVARQGVIMIVAATTKNFENRQYFSYQNLPVLSVGGARQDYHLSHWFEEKTTQRRIEFASSCLNMKYDFGKEMNIFPNNHISTLNRHLNGFHQGDIALIWYKKAEMPTVLERAKAAKMAGLIIVNGPYKERQNCEIPLFDISTDDALFIEEGYKDNRGYKYIFAEKYGYIEDGSATVDTTARHNQPFMPPFYPDILAPSHRLFTAWFMKK